MEQRARVMGKKGCQTYIVVTSKDEKITKQKMNEDVSRSDLDQIEKYADKLFACRN